MTPEEILQNIPKKHKAKYKIAMEGRSRKKAMESFCLVCVGYESSEIPKCTDTGCPLYPYRLR